MPTGKEVDGLDIVLPSGREGRHLLEQVESRWAQWLRPAECQKDTAGGTQPVAAGIAFSPKLPTKGNTEVTGDTSTLAVLPINQAFWEISSGPRQQW